MKQSLINKNRILAFILVLITTVSVLCACTKNNGNDVVSMPLSTPVVHELAAGGGTLTMPMPINADISNPYTVDTEEMLNFFSLVYEGIVEITEDNSIVPALAENWSCDSDGKTWTFKLRKDVKWHFKDEALDAYDIEYSIAKIRSYEGDSYYSYNVSKIESVEVADKNTLKITMTEKGLLPLRCLDFPIVRNNAPLSGKPDGTGPYAFESSDEECVLLKVNENWWKQHPYIKNVKFIARDSNETALASFSAGQFNMVPTSAITAGRYRQEGVSDVLDVMTQDMEVLVVNHKNPILSDARVRQAIAYLIDRAEIISNVCMNRARACDVPIAPDSFIYDSKSKIYDHSVQEAERLFKEALCLDTNGDMMLEKNGEDIKFNILVCTSLDGTRAEAAKHISQQLLKAGIQSEIVNASYSTASGGEFMEKLKNGEYDIALVGLNMARDCDLSMYLEYGGECNYGSFYNRELAQLAQQMYNATDEDELKQKASAFEMKFAQELPFIVLYFRLNSIVYSDDIKEIGAVREPDLLRKIENWYISASEN